MISTAHIHPILVHFPIALILLGFLADILSIYLKKENSLDKTSFYLLITGTIGAFFAWLSGNLFAAHVSGAAHDIKETHETFAMITLILLLITGIIRIYIIKKNEIKWLKKISFITYVLSAISVAITGYLGGILVYNYMIN